MPTTFGATGHVLDLGDTEGFKLGRRRPFPEATHPTTLVFTNFSSDELADRLTQKYFHGRGGTGDVGTVKPNRMSKSGLVAAAAAAQRPKTAYVRGGRAGAWTPKAAADFLASQRMAPSVIGDTRYGMTTEMLTDDDVSAHRQKRVDESRQAFTEGDHNESYLTIYARAGDGIADRGSPVRAPNQPSKGKRTMPHRRITKALFPSEKEMEAARRERLALSQNMTQSHDPTYLLVYARDDPEYKATALSGKRRDIVHQTFDDVQETRACMAAMDERARLLKQQRARQHGGGGRGGFHGARAKSAGAVRQGPGGGGLAGAFGGAAGRKVRVDSAAAVVPAARSSTKSGGHGGSSKLSRAVKAAIAHAHRARTVQSEADAARTRDLLATAMHMGAPLTQGDLPPSLRGGTSVFQEAA